ncbi:MAG: sulfatase-like hydrolase/transferase, partial [Planctomycetes bacterium]|nr:sulfatase-like hydrolase/transferase [Planctomycetota bacterium]
GSFYDPSSLVRDDNMISPYADPDYKPKTYYYTDAIADHAVRNLAEHARDHSDQPFFLYVAFTAAHWPMHALPDDIARYKGMYDGGYEEIRRTRFAKSSKLGVIDSTQRMTTGAKSWSDVDNKPWEAACMEVYAAMVDRMDQGIGKMIQELKRTGQLENTLIFYLQDNGGCAENIGRTGNKQHPNIPRPLSPPMEPMKNTEFAAAGSTPSQTRDGYPVRMGNQVMPGPDDTYIAYGEGWANVSNTPFREYKHWVHEGGISTPLIAHWPRGISSKGELRNQPGHLIDIAATCLDLSGAQYPTSATPLEGRSLRPAFANRPIEREAIFWEHEGNRAVRKGDWKLVAKHAQDWELYNIAKDRVESNNLAASQPEIVDELRKRYDAYASRTGVESWPVRNNE